MWTDGNVWELRRRPERENMLGIQLHTQDAGFLADYQRNMAAYGGLLAAVQQGEDRYKEFLGWHSLEESAGEEVLARLEQIAARIRSQSDTLVLIGVGGSNNGARSAIKALEPQGGIEVVYGGNTLSPHSLGRLLERLEGRSVSLLCIAKNFSTLEPGAGFRVLRRYMSQRYGAEAAGRIYVTGTPGSLSQQICESQGYVFVDFPPRIGGRYSVLSNVGLLPMAVAGVNISAMVRGAGEMEERLRSVGALENPAYAYAVFRKTGWDRGLRIELLAYFEPRLRYFAKWWMQLFAESEGKDGRGLFAAAGEYSEELHAVGQYLQEGSPIVMESFLRLMEAEEDISAEGDGLEDGFAYLDTQGFARLNMAAYSGTLAAHSSRMPCVSLELERLDAAHLGGLYYFFLFSCYLYCRMLGVHPFDQEGVEDYKRRMFAALGREV